MGCFFVTNSKVLSVFLYFFKLWKVQSDFEIIAFLGILYIDIASYDIFKVKTVVDRYFYVELIGVHLKSFWVIFFVL